MTGVEHISVLDNRDVVLEKLDPLVGEDTDLSSVLPAEAVADRLRQLLEDDGVTDGDDLLRQ